PVRQSASSARIIHPRARALRWPGVGIEVELADARAVALDAEEAHVRMPDRRLVGKDVHSEQSPDDPEQAVEHPGKLEVLLDLLVGERIALLLQLLGGECDVPGLERLDTESLPCELGQFGQVALR